MARKRKPKQTEQTPVTLKELPRDAEELTGEEAEATKGGWFATLTPAAQAMLGAMDASDTPSERERKASN